MSEREKSDEERSRQVKALFFFSSLFLFHVSLSKVSLTKLVFVNAPLSDRLVTVISLSLNIFSLSKSVSGIDLPVQTRRKFLPRKTSRKPVPSSLRS